MLAMDVGLGTAILVQLDVRTILCYCLQLQMGYDVCWISVRNLVINMVCTTMPKRLNVFFTPEEVSTTSPVIKLCGKQIKWVDKVKHLGNVISSNTSESADMKHKKGDLIQRVNCDGNT